MDKEHFGRLIFFPWANIFDWVKWFIFNEYSNSKL